MGEPLPSLFSFLRRTLERGHSPPLIVLLSPLRYYFYPPSAAPKSRCLKVLCMVPGVTPLSELILYSFPPGESKWGPFYAQQNTRWPNLCFIFCCCFSGGRFRPIKKGPPSPEKPSVHGCCSSCRTSSSISLRPVSSDRAHGNYYAPSRSDVGSSNSFRTLPLPFPILVSGWKPQSY